MFISVEHIYILINFHWLRNESTKKGKNQRKLFRRKLIDNTRHCLRDSPSINNSVFGKWSSCFVFLAFGFLSLRICYRMPTGQRTQVRARTGTNNRRPRPRAAPRDNHNRLPCPRGSSCPYIDEYQHGLEFSHDRPAVQQPTVEPFSGPAHRLGFADPRFQGLAGLEGMDGFYDGRGLLGLPGFLSGGEDNTFCSVCNSKISRVDLESHIEQHEAAVLAESLRMHQDKELEESMLQDCARLEEQARKKKEEENRLQAEEEQKELQEAIEESKRLAAISKCLGSLLEY